MGLNYLGLWPPATTDKCLVISKRVVESPSCHYFSERRGIEFMGASMITIWIFPFMTMSVPHIQIAPIIGRYASVAWIGNSVVFPFPPSAHWPVFHERLSLAGSVPRTPWKCVFPLVHSVQDYRHNLGSAKDAKHASVFASSNLRIVWRDASAWWTTLFSLTSLQCGDPQL